MTRLQFLVLRITGIDLLDAQEGPVRGVGKAFLIAHPSATGTAVREDDGIRLQAVHDAPCLGIIVIGTAVNLTLLVRTAIPSVATVGTVEPHLEHVAILGHQLLELLVVVSDILGRAVAGLMSVPRREIDAKTDTVLLTGIRQFAHHIALERGVGDAVIGIFGVPQAKAVMVLASENNGFHASLDKGLHPLFAIQPGGVEDLGRGVSVAPLLIGKGIQPKMDEGISLQALPSHLLRRWHG